LSYATALSTRSTTIVIRSLNQVGSSSKRSAWRDPAALELEHLGEQIEVRVVVEDANGAILQPLQ